MNRRVVFRSSLFLLVPLVLSSTALAGTTWYVDGVNGSDSNDCKSPQTACKTIGHAISLASSGDTAMIAAATYTENLTINLSLTIIGASAATTIIDGGGAATVVRIQAGSHVTLSKVTIQHGSSCADGGGIRNKGRLTVNDTTISANSTIGYGGGVYNLGTLMLNSTMISGNQSGGFGCGGLGEGSGGGIYNNGTLRLVATTIDGNTAYGPCFEEGCLLGGGSGVGGGITNSNGTLTVINSTLTGNTARAAGHLSHAYGGGIANAATTDISSSTLTGNAVGAHFSGGGGIYGNVTLQNTIVANSPNGGNCYGTMTSNGYNLSSDNTCNFSGSGDLNNTDPKLGTLGNNGGPTQTIPLLSGSPAIDAGNPNGCTDGHGHLLKTDQRGKPRPDKEDNGGCDMGAYERQRD